MVDQLGDDPHALLGGLAGPVDRLGHALAERSMMVDEGIAEIGERQPPQAGDRLVGGDGAGPQAVDQRPQGGLVHAVMLAEIWRLNTRWTRHQRLGRRLVAGNSLRMASAAAPLRRLSGAVRHVHRAGVADADRSGRR